MKYFEACLENFFLSDPILVALPWFCGFGLVPWCDLECSPWFWSAGEESGCVAQVWLDCFGKHFQVGCCFFQALAKNCKLCIVQRNHDMMLSSCAHCARRAGEVGLLLGCRPAVTPPGFICALCWPGLAGRVCRVLIMILPLHLGRVPLQCCKILIQWQHEGGKVERFSTLLEEFQRDALNGTSASTFVPSWPWLRRQPPKWRSLVQREVKQCLCCSTCAK